MINRSYQDSITKITIEELQISKELLQATDLNNLSDIGANNVIASGIIPANTSFHNT